MLARLRKRKNGDLPDTFWIEDLDSLRAPRRPNPAADHRVAGKAIERQGDRRGDGRSQDPALSPHQDIGAERAHPGGRGTKARALNERVFVAAAKEFRPGPGILEEATGDEMAEALLTTVLDTTRADFIRAVRSDVVRLDEIGEHQLLAVGRCLVRLPDAKAERSHVRWKT